jgi:hypothetical protein
MYDTVEAQLVGGYRVPLAHQEQWMQCEAQPHLKAGVCEGRFARLSSGINA